MPSGAAAKVTVSVTPMPKSIDFSSRVSANAPVRAEGDSEGAQDGALPDYHANHVAAGRPESHPYPDLMSALRNRVGNQAVNSDGREQ